MSRILRDPTLDRLAHSVLWPGFVGLDAPEWLLRALDRGLGGAVYFAQNIDPTRPEQVSDLSTAIHATNGNALIGVDEEGGIVSRLEAVSGSSTPGNAVLGRLDDVGITEQTAAWIGVLVAAAGIDVDIAPTVDVNSNSRNPVIGVRSFSADPVVVARHAAAYVRGIQGTGVAACAKHFPGHGDTVTDTHLTAATSNVTLDELYAIHLLPFAAAIDVWVKAIMSAHIRIPGLGVAPATVNKVSLSIARELGFEGVLVTDALDMAAIRATLGVGPGAVAALHAGADLLCVGNPATNGRAGDDEAEYREPLEAIYAALSSGDLAVERVEEAARRNAALAAWCRKERAVSAPPAYFDGVPLAMRAAQLIGDVRLTRDGAVVVDARVQRSIAVGDAADFFTVALREFRHVDRLAVGGLDVAAAVATASSALARQGTDVVLIVNQPQSSPFEAAVLDAVLTARPDAIVIYSGWPLESGQAASRALATYGASRSTAEAAARILSGLGSSAG